MTYRITFGIALAAAFAGAAPVGAEVLTFTGTRANVNPVNPLGVGRCGPGRSTVNIGPTTTSSTGSSNFGDFSSTQSHCLTPPLPTSYDGGIFTYDFAAGDSLFGTYGGTISLSDTPGVFNALENLVVTGGTGRFLGATGTLTNMGTLRFISGNGVYSGAVSGTLVVPSVPEPATWMSMIGGFGLLGMALRGKRAGRRGPISPPRASAGA